MQCRRVLHTVSVKLSMFSSNIQITQKHHLLNDWRHFSRNRTRVPLDIWVQHKFVVRDLPLEIVAAECWGRERDYQLQEGRSIDPHPLKMTPWCCRSATDFSSKFCRPKQSNGELIKFTRNGQFLVGVLDAENYKKSPQIVVLRPLMYSQIL